MAASIFDLLTNKVTVSITFEYLSVPNGQKALAGLVLDHSGTGIIQKKLDCNQLVFFTKKNRSFLY